MIDESTVIKELARGANSKNKREREQSEAMNRVSGNSVDHTGSSEFLDKDVLYAAHIANRSSVPVRVRALFSTTSGAGTGASAATTSTEAEEVLQPGTETIFKERYYGPHDNIRMEIMKIYCDSTAGSARHSERQAPFGKLDKQYADFDIVEDGLGNLQLNKNF